jgi:hypothetical protein
VGVWRSLLRRSAVSVSGVSGGVGAYVAQVDRALAEGQSLFPAQVGPVGVVTDLPPATPAPPGISGTRSGAEAAAGHYSGQWKAARIADDGATAAANEAAELAAAGRAAATRLRTTAQAQAVAMAPAAEAGPAGRRALVAAMNEKLAALHHLIETSDRHNQQLASRLRHAADIHELLQPAAETWPGLASGELLPVRGEYIPPPGNPRRIGDKRYGHWEKVWTRTDPGTESSARRADQFPQFLEFQRAFDLSGKLVPTPAASISVPGLAEAAEEVRVKANADQGAPQGMPLGWRSVGRAGLAPGTPLDGSDQGLQAAQPQLTPEFRPLSEPIEGPSTGLYAPVKTWIQKSDKPASVVEVSDQFRIIGTEATTETRWVPGSEPGTWTQERWVANVYEAKTSTGNVGGEGVDGSPAVGTGSKGIGIPAGKGLFSFPFALPGDWYPISLEDIYAKSQSQPATTFYLPTAASITDVDCRPGAVMTLKDGAFTGFVGDPQGPPSMTKPGG